MTNGQTSTKPTTPPSPKSDGLLPNAKFGARVGTGKWALVAIVLAVLLTFTGVMAGPILGSIWADYGKSVVYPEKDAPIVIDLEGDRFSLSPTAGTYIDYTINAAELTPQQTYKVILEVNIEDDEFWARDVTEVLEFKANKDGQANLQGDFYVYARKQVSSIDGDPYGTGAIYQNDYPSTVCYVKVTGYDDYKWTEISCTIEMQQRGDDEEITFYELSVYNPEEWTYRITEKYDEVVFVTSEDIRAVHVLQEGTYYIRIDEIGAVRAISLYHHNAVSLAGMDTGLTDEEVEEIFNDELVDDYTRSTGGTITLMSVVLICIAIVGVVLLAFIGKNARPKGRKRGKSKPRKSKPRKRKK